MNTRENINLQTRVGVWWCEIRPYFLDIPHRTHSEGPSSGQLYCCILIAARLPHLLYILGVHIYNLLVFRSDPKSSTQLWQSENASSMDGHIGNWKDWARTYFNKPLSGSFANTAHAPRIYCSNSSSSGVLLTMCWTSSSVPNNTQTSLPCHAPESGSVDSFKLGKLPK
jgi:hypothetical protein